MPVEDAFLTFAQSCPLAEITRV